VGQGRKQPYKIILFQPAIQGLPQSGAILAVPVKVGPQPIWVE
jgi:hypothetical protein